MYTEIINPDNLSLDYIQQEIAQVEREKHRRVRKVEILDNGDGTSTQRFWFRPVAFDRVRRITGYLTDNLSRMNAGKTAELRDRVPHGI